MVLFLFLFFLDFFFLKGSSSDAINISYYPLKV